MVSKKTLAIYEFDTMEDYFQYISESLINGQRSQAINLASDMSLKQKAEALRYFYRTPADMVAVDLIISIL